MEDSKTDKRLEAARDLNDWMSWYWSILAGDARPYSDLLIRDLSPGGSALRMAADKKLTYADRSAASAVRNIERWKARHDVLLTECESIVAEMIIRDMSKEADS